MTNASPAAASEPVRVTEEDMLRAELYALLARLLAAPPAAELLARLAGLSGDETPIGEAVGRLGAGARSADPAQIEREYAALFIGLGAGELIPYGSHYLTGFLHEKPLAQLRADMARLGVAAAEGNPDPEDHIASLCEMMAGLILGRFGAPLPLCGQHQFFAAHIAPWAARFFADLEAAPSSSFYRPVGLLGRLFIDIETQAFALAAQGHNGRGEDR